MTPAAIPVVVCERIFLKQALWRVRQDDLSAIPDRTYETFQKIRDMTPYEEGSDSGVISLEEMSLVMYTTLVVCAIERLQEAESVSATEAELVTCILHLLNATKRIECYRVSGGVIFSDGELVAEGRRRLYTQ